MLVEASTTIDRNVADVWEFYAVNHVANHPRWDETIELEAEFTIGGDIPGIEESTAEQIRTMMGKSVANIKALIESDS
jgi:hypothetical protein